jgi:hypothetical protein
VVISPPSSLIESRYCGVVTGLVKVLAGACLTLPVAMFQVILIRPPAQESILLAALPETVTKAVLSAWEAERSGLARSLTWEAKYPRVSVMDLALPG